MERYPCPTHHVLRQLPVDFQQAPEQAIAAIHRLQPDRVVACGMAENRTRLSLESRAVGEGEVLHTGFDLAWLMADLTFTEISHDAGRFVCNALYHALLQEQQSIYPHMQCLFVHVPPLTAANRDAIMTDFQTILDRIASC